MHRLEGMEVLEYLSRRELKGWLDWRRVTGPIFGGSSRFCTSHVWLYPAWDGFRGVVSKSRIPLDLRATSRCVDLCRFCTIHGNWFVACQCYYAEAFMKATLVLNSRHIFYGLSVMSRYPDRGLSRWYLIFGLTDETYSLITARSPQSPGNVRYLVYLT